MAKDERIRMPFSGAGITQFWSEVKTKVELKPSQVVLLIILVIILELLLYWQGSALIG